MISLILSFIMEDAVIWAQLYIEVLAEGNISFNSSWTEFIKQFLAKFEPVDAKNKVKQKLVSIKQGNCTFADYLSEFETWSPRTDWSNTDLFDYLKQEMNSDYTTRLFYFSVCLDIYKKVKKYGHAIDLQVVNFAMNKDKPLSGTSLSSGLSNTCTTGFHDSNTIDIDVST